MSFYVYDTDGYVGDLASIGGWGLFRKAAEELGGAAWEFAEDGYTENPEGLAGQLADVELEGSAEDTRKLLVEYAGKAKECLILTDGEDGSDEDKSGVVFLQKDNA